MGQQIARCSFQILAATRDEHGEGQTGSATGFFVTPDGLMITSAHVVEDAVAAQVLCGRDRRARGAQLVARDLDLDLALLAVDINVPCEYLPLGSSAELLPPEPLLVFGYAHVRPGEPGRLVTASVARNDVDNPRDVETDGDIEEGFSGGPAVRAATGEAVALVKGGYGRSATLLVRGEQVMALLAGLGYEIG